ncbi:MAG: sensor histidine kinase [Bulleidia sp.]
MIQKLKRKFMIVSLSCVAAVLLVVLGCINGYNLYHNTRMSDEILQILSENQGKFPPRRDLHDKPDPGLSPETPYETRYFTVTLDQDNNVISTNTVNIISVDEITAISLAQQVVNNTKGTLKQFRYLVSDTGNTKTVIFLDDTRNQNSFYNTLKSSILMAVIGITGVGILLFIFSDRAIAPIIESHQKQKQFITDASHELKTPLTVISADLELLEMEHGRNQWTEDMAKQTGRLHDLTLSLICLARMDEGKQQTFVETPLSDLVEECIQAFTFSVQAAQLTIQQNIEPVISIMADATQITQLCSILMDNAIRYSRPDTQISVSLHKTGRQVAMTVTNTSNQQITDHDLKHLLDRFYRGDGSRSTTKGFGLGLSMAQEIVHTHHGRITASCGDHTTLTIRITFPSVQIS